MVQRRSRPSSGSGAPGSPPSSTGRVNVPHVTKDPIASLCPWPFTVEAGGLDYEVPAWTAADWLRVLMDVEYLSSENLILELIPQGADLLLDEGITDEEVITLGLEMLELAGGRPWYISVRLIAMLQANWNVLGAELLRHHDPSAMSLSGFLDVALLQALRTMEENQVSMFVAQLEMPPPGVEIPEEEMEMTREQFLSLAN